MTFLSPHLKQEQVEFFPVELSVKGQEKPYIILYTFIPKHNSFIVVRLPKEDLI